MDPRGLEPRTPALQKRCAANCAMSPFGTCVSPWCLLFSCQPSAPYVGWGRSLIQHAWSRAGSNRRPLPFQGSALPTEPQNQVADPSRSDRLGTVSNDAGARHARLYDRRVAPLHVAGSLVQGAERAGVEPARPCGQSHFERGAAAICRLASPSGCASRGWGRTTDRPGFRTALPVGGSPRLRAVRAKRFTLAPCGARSQGTLPVATPGPPGLPSPQSHSLAGQRLRPVERTRLPHAAKC